MTILRWIVAAGVVVAVAIVVFRVQVPRYRCNTLKATYQSATAADWASRGDYQATQRSRRRIGALERCAAVSPLDADMQMILALNYRILGRLDEAAAAYRNALAYDRRPEIFLNLGLVELELERHSDAVNHLAHAVAFDVSYARHFDGDELQQEVAAAAEALRARAAARK